MSKWENMKEVAQNDLEALKRAETSYGDSWRRRGGVGAFMMLARKFDRIEHQSESTGGMSSKQARSTKVRQVYSMIFETYVDIYY